MTEREIIAAQFTGYLQSAASLMDHQIPVVGLLLTRLREYDGDFIGSRLIIASLIDMIIDNSPEAERDGQLIANPFHSSEVDVVIWIITFSKEIL